MGHLLGREFARLVSAAAMEASVVPEEIAEAIPAGEVEVVRSWLDNGGDASAKCQVSRHDGTTDLQPLLLAEPLLVAAAPFGRASIIDLLLSRGADIDATDADGRTALYQLLNYWRKHLSIPALGLLLSHGIDVNLAIHSGDFAGKSPLMIAVTFGPDIVRLLLRAGADLEHRGRTSRAMAGLRTAEQLARSNVRLWNPEEHCASADFLSDVRLAGGWTRYFLRPHKSVLVLRALCHRGRATFSARTPEVLVRLFGAPDGRRRTRSTRATEGVRAHLPDPLFWRVLEFSLGTAYDYPWVRERVRARAALSRGGRGSR